MKCSPLLSDEANGKSEPTCSTRAAHLGGEGPPRLNARSSAFGGSYSAGNTGAVDARMLQPIINAVSTLLGVIVSKACKVAGGCHLCMQQGCNLIRCTHESMQPRATFPHPSLQSHNRFSIVRTHFVMYGGSCWTNSLIVCTPED